MNRVITTFNSEQRIFNGIQSIFDSLEIDSQRLFLSTYGIETIQGLRFMPKDRLELIYKELFEKLIKPNREIAEANPELVAIYNDLRC